MIISALVCAILCTGIVDWGIIVPADRVSGFFCVCLGLLSSVLLLVMML